VVVSGGHTLAHAPPQALIGPLSASNRYSVRPCASTSTLPSFVFASLTDDPPPPVDGAFAAAGVVDDDDPPYALPPPQPATATARASFGGNAVAWSTAPTPSSPEYSGSLSGS